MRYNLTLWALLILCSFSTEAQTGLYNDGGTLHANKSSILHISGDMQNKAGSTTQNDGVIELTGNFSNDSLAILVNGSDSSSTERVYKFVGAGTQQISGNISDSTRRYFYNLVIDKSATATNVGLGANTWVKGSLVFGSATAGSATYTPTTTSTLSNNNGFGLIRTFDSLNNDHELYVTNAAVNAVMGYAPLVINGAPTNGYIINRGAKGVGLGGFSRNVSSTGVPYIFPIGTALNGYNADAITFNSLPGTDKVRGMFVDATGGVGSLSQYCNTCGSSPYGPGFNYYFANNPYNANTGQWITLDQLPIDHGYWSYTGNDADEYSVQAYPNSFTAFGTAAGAMWRVIKDSGSISSIPDGDWTPQILGDVSAVNDLLKYTTNTGAYIGGGVPGGSYKGFGNFQMARSAGGEALPVELVSLVAVPIDNKYIQLQWVTASEIDNKGYQILRSNDGSNFQDIGWVPAAGDGNSVTTSEYSFNDQNAEPNTLYYYKLNQQDVNGNSHETYIVQAQISGETSMTVSSFFPNPASANTRISVYTSTDIHITMEIYDMLGKLLDRNEFPMQAGGSQYELNTSNLPSGIYKAVIRSGNNVFVNSLNIIR